MRRVFHLYRSSVGKKILMALSGLMLLGFVLGHLVGNLKAYQGAEKYDHYAHALRDVGAPFFGESQFLWLFRAVLLGAFSLHVYSAFRLTRQSRAALGGRYRKGNDLTFSYASRTMRWGGVIVLAFIVYHLLHLTLGTVHHDFDASSPYRNLVTAFRQPWIASAYMLAILPLGLHIYHGLWSATQTLSLRSPRIARWRRPVAATIAGAIVAGNLSLPIAVLAGVISLEG